LLLWLIVVASDVDSAVEVIAAAVETVEAVGTVEATVAGS
jgi:hypothetical protein